MAGIETLERHHKPSEPKHSACGVPSDVRYTMTISYEGQQVLVVRDLDRTEWLDAGRLCKRLFPRSDGYVYRTEARRV